MSLPYSDLHVHTRYSKDVRDEASTFENLARWGAEAGVAVGFADHFEATFLERDGYCFREENMSAYLEDFDRTRSAFPETTLGVELEFYNDRPELNALTLEWLDRHRSDLDRVLGSAHHVFGDHAVTWHVHMCQLRGRRTFPEIMDEYLRGMGMLIGSGLADHLAHADVVFRGNEQVFDIEPEVRRRGEARVLQLCRDAVMRGMAIEVNLLGMVDGTDRGPSPPLEMARVLAGEGATMYVGSDAHDSEGLRRGLPLVIKTWEILASTGALQSLVPSTS